MLFSNRGKAFFNAIGIIFPFFFRELAGTLNNVKYRDGATPS
jgi:hypothetical protein